MQFQRRDVPVTGFSPRAVLRGLLACFICFPPTLDAAPVSGEAVYKSRCAGCHELVSPRIPTREALQRMSRARILRSLDFGAMMSIAYPMSRQERERVAAFLGTTRSDAVNLPVAFCSAQLALADQRRARLGGDWNGWSPSPSNTRYQSADEARLTIDQVRKLRLKWAFGFEGDVTAFGAPTVVEGKLFVGSAAGVVYSLNAETGCNFWTFLANGPVRSAVLDVRSASGDSLLFGDQNGWFYSLDSRSGRLRWKRRLEEHEAARLTGAPIEKDGAVFVPVASWEETRGRSPQYACCTFRGSVVALRVRDGSVVWKSYMVPLPEKRGITSVGTARYGPSGAGIWSAPTLDAKRGRIYVTTGDNYSSPATATSDAIVALELKTGRIIWTRQTASNDVFNLGCSAQGPNCPAENGPDHDYGASVSLVKTSGGREVLLAGQKSGMVYALDPEQEGKILWEARVGKGGRVGGVQWGMASDGQHLFAAVSDVVLRPRKTSGPDDLRTFDLDPTEGGGMTALRVEDGRKIWHVPGHACDTGKPGCSPAQSAAVTAIAGAVFSGSMDGHLRAFAAEDGALLWDFDTARNYQTLNGVVAKGGSLDGAGPVIVGGMIFVNSGYARFGGMAGNVLLAFAPEP